MTRYIQIAIDGKAATGKSTIGALLAQSLGYLFIDSGLLYRALTVEALRLQINQRDELAIVELAKTTLIEIVPTSHAELNRSAVLVDGVNVTSYVNLPDIDKATPHVASYPLVRDTLIGRMRELAAENSVVMAGRDIGTVVLPQADLKIYLSVELSERARRRHKDLVAKYGESAPSVLLIQHELERRDVLDTVHSMPANDAIGLRNDVPTRELVATIQALLAEKLGAEPGR